MHCAAAAGVPTLGLFGASYASLYAPFGAKTLIAHTPKSYDDLQREFQPDQNNFDPKLIKGSMLLSLSVDMVERKAQELWQKSKKEAA
jgi:ADP-heptose:LPS heptosyltransferase